MDPATIAMLASAGVSVGSSLYNMFTGGPKTEQFNQYTPEQQQALNFMLQQGLGGLQSGNVNLGPIEQNARRQFETQTVPSIAERFTAMGNNSRLGNPAFSSSLGNAGAGLEQGLAQLRYDQLFRMLQGGLTPQFDTVHNQRPSGAESLSKLGSSIFGATLPFAYLNSMGQQPQGPAETPPPPQSFSMPDISGLYNSGRTNPYYQYRPQYNQGFGLY